MKNVIFLGAGASKADGTPVQNEIFDKFFEMCECVQNNMNPRNGGSFIVGTPVEEYMWSICCYYNNIEMKVKNFLKEYFGDITNKNYPTFEETLALIDISIQRNEIFENDRYNLVEFKNVLVEIIKKTIEYYQTKSNHKYCNSLVRNLLEMNKLSETVFVTTNYDLLLENAIYDIGRKINFGLEYVDDKSAVELYKIHGSLNWFQCPKCNTIHFKNGNCPKCKAKTSPIIILPSYFKTYQNKYLHRIWELTEKSFSEADNIIFCGYSFPDADIYIKYLLKRGEFLGKEHKYYIVNYFDGKSKEDIDIETQRYERFLKCKANINYTEYSFEMFASDPSIIIKI